MKKLIAIVLAVVALAACSKEKLDTRLVGTKWQTHDLAAEMFNGKTCYEVYEFVSAKEVERYTTKNGMVVSSSGTYSYKLDYPSITIYDERGSGEGFVNYTFTDSRTMVRDGTDGSGFYAKYIKQ